MFTDIFIEDIYTQLEKNTFYIDNLNDKIKLLTFFITCCVMFVILSLVVIVYEMHLLKYKLKTKINKLKINV